MTNEEKAGLYHSLLLQHDKLEGKISDIKSEAAGMTLNDDQNNRVNILEQQKAQIVAQAQELFETY